MDHDQDSLPDPTSEFGELFGGETAVFESAYSDGILGLENGIDIVPMSSSSNQQQSYHGGMISSNTYQQHNHQISINLSDLSHLINSDSMEDQEEGEGDEGINVDDIQYLPEEYILTNHNVESEEQQQMEDTLEYIEEVNSVQTDNNEFADDDYVTEEIPENESKTKVTVVKDVEHFAKVNINKYLKRRGYQEVNVPTTVSRSSFAENIDPEISNLNAITYGPNYKAEEICEELEKFWKFYNVVKTRNLSMSTELKPMFFPMLVYFFYECCTAGKAIISLKLITDFCRRFLLEDKNTENTQIILSMSKVKNYRELEEDELLNQVYNKDCKFFLSEWTFSQLKKFLSKLSRPLLINLFSSHFIIAIQSSQEVLETWQDHSDVIDSDSESDDEEKENDTVDRVINRLRGSVKANLPSMIVYTTNGRPICGAVSQEATSVAYGMSASGIRVCSTSSAKRLFSKSQAEEEDDDDTTECSSSIQTASGHEGSVYGVSFHPRTRLLFSVGQDKVMRAWNLNSYSNIDCKVVYRGHLGPIWSMDITGSGNLIATGSMDTTTRIWVPERVECVRILAGHYFDVDCVRFHPNEAFVATGSVDKSVRFWSISDGNMVRIMTGAEGRISAVAYHASGKYLAGGGEEDRIRIWDIAEGEVLAELSCSSCYCKDLTFYGNMLSACFRNGTVQVWNLRNIVGGDDMHADESFSSDVESVPAPCLVQCQASSLFKLYYKDSCNLYCLGADPLIDEENDLESNKYETFSISSVPTSPSSGIDSPVYARFSDSNCNVSSTVTSETATPTSSSTSNDTPEDLINYCLEEADEDSSDNTNNTITSSDMDFEVDEQMLQSLVDEHLLEP